MQTVIAVHSFVDAAASKCLETVTSYARPLRARRFVVAMNNGYAGNFNCGGPCGRVRLTAAEFSRRQLTLFRGGELTKAGKVLRCKRCVEAAASAERAAAAKRHAESSAGADESAGSQPASATASAAAPTGGKEPEAQCFTCVACRHSLPGARFTRNQISKAKKGKRNSPKCQDCVRAQAEAEASTVEAKRESRLADARAGAQAAFHNSRGSRKGRGGAAGVAARLAAATAETAAEAEAVTGLRAVRGGSRAGRGGRWSSRGRRRGRGRR